VRELKNVVERAVYRADAPLIREITFNPFGSTTVETEERHTRGRTLEEGPALRPLKQAVQELEVRLFKEALRASKYNQKKAAERLGLTYHQFRGLYRKYRDKEL
jgi:psp operon transcriptional activator